MAQLLLVVVSPVVNRLKGIRQSLGLKHTILIDILDLQPRLSPHVSGQSRRLTALDLLFSVWFGLLYPIVALLSIDIFDIQSVPYELPSVFCCHLRG